MTMTKGLAVYVKDLARIKTTVQLFNTQHWQIDGENAYRYTTLFEKGKPKKIFFGVSKTETIFPQIKLLFDQKERVIAQRLNSNGRLITTRENKYFKVRNHRSERALEVYALITAIEEKEYEEMIQNYWYQERKRA